MRQPVSSFGGARLGQALYMARVAALDEIVGNTLIDQEAKARGQSVPELTVVCTTLTSFDCLGTKASLQGQTADYSD